MIERGYVATTSGLVHWRQVMGEGPPLVMLHRTPTSSASFERVLALLEGRRRAIALDTPGFGQSFRPDGSPTTLTYAQWFLDALKGMGVDRFYLFGHHTGTHFATEMARASPERVLNLTLSGVMYETPEARAAIRGQIGSAPAIDEGGAHLTKVWNIVKGLFDPYDPVLVHTEVMGALGSPDGCNQAFDAIFSQDFAGVLKAVRAPVRIIQAEDDPLTSYLDRVRQAHPEMPIELHGPAGMAAPELRADVIVDRLLDYIRLDKTPSL